MKGYTQFINPRNPKVASLEGSTTNPVQTGISLYYLYHRHNRPPNRRSHAYLVLGHQPSRSEYPITLTGDARRLPTRRFRSHCEGLFQAQVRRFQFGPWCPATRRRKEPTLLSFVLAILCPSLPSFPLPLHPLACSLPSSGSCSLPVRILGVDKRVAQRLSTSTCLELPPVSLAR